MLYSCNKATCSIAGLTALAVVEDGLNGHVFNLH